MYKTFLMRHLQRIHMITLQVGAAAQHLQCAWTGQIAVKLKGCLMRPNRSGKILQPYLEEERCTPSLPSSGDTDRAPLCRLLAGCRGPPSKAALLIKMGSTSILGACLPDGLSMVPAAATEPATPCCVAAAVGAWKADNTAGSVPDATCCEAVSAGLAG